MDELMESFYETHAHLDFPDFENDLEAVVRRAHEAGIVKIITIATDLKSSRRAIELSERFPQVYAVVGWHPSHASEAPVDIRPELREMARHPRVVALGETGLDYYRLPGKREGGRPEDDEPYIRKQMQIYQQHLEVARETGLNCVIHQRTAFEDTVRMLEPFAPAVRGVFHCYVDDAERQRRIQSLGSLVSFTGIVTFRNAQDVRDTVATTPLDQLMLETDCPYLAPDPYRGKRGEPAYVKEISRIVAETKKCTLAELSQATCKTAHGFFRHLEN